MDYIDDETEELQKYELNKEIQNEIKDKVISRLLLAVERQYKELMAIKKENESLKSHLTYILKRIILYKNEFNIERKNGSNIGPIKIKNSFFKDFSRMKSSKNNKHVRSVEANRRKLDNNMFETATKKFNKSRIDDNYIYQPKSNKNVDLKVKGYLNKIYRENFLKTRNVLTNNLDKKQTIYKELFPSAQKNYNTINHDETFLTEKTDYLKLFKNNTTIKDNSYLDTEGNKSPLNEDRKIRIKRINPKKTDGFFKIKDYNEELIKDINLDYLDYNYNDNDNDNNDNENSYNDYNRNRNKNQNHNHNHNQRKSNFYNKSNKNTYGDKIRAKKELLYMKRSPFLVNKLNI